jgi:hypothetical protein
MTVSILFDVESNGFLNPTTKNGKVIPAATKLHCLVALHVETGDVYTFRDNEPGMLPMSDAIDLLNAADEVCGHNIKGYDIPLLQKFYPHFQPKNVVDTYEMCKAFFTIEQLQIFDLPLADSGLMTIDELGRHSLMSWSLRLGNPKLHYTGGFDTYSEDMLIYCIQDVMANKTVYDMLLEMVEGE